MNNGVIGVYLAAGQSRRMGCNKLKLPLGRMPLGSIALHAALQSKIGHLLVVVQSGDPLDWITPDLTEPPLHEKWEAVECRDAHQGMAYSLKCGVAAAEQREADAIVVMLADQPGVSSQMLNELIGRSQSHSPGTVKPLYYAFQYEGLPRPPILIRREAFSRLHGLEGDEGARRVIRMSAPQEAVFLESTDAGSFVDFDTYDEYTARKDEYGV